MPDKEGSDDEKKSTKSVVNKKQKQMMGEEGYDIARDEGRVSPSKDKKDATTMPVSDEVKKTQKKSKGKSALELIKKKYGKAVMDVNKKKANEELDLTKVADSFGGEIIGEPVELDEQYLKLFTYGARAQKFLKSKPGREVLKTITKNLNPNTYRQTLSKFKVKGTTFASNVGEKIPFVKKIIKNKRTKNLENLRNKQDPTYFKPETKPEIKPEIKPETKPFRKPRVIDKKTKNSFKDALNKNQNKNKSKIGTTTKVAGGVGLTGLGVGTLIGRQTKNQGAGGKFRPRLPQTSHNVGRTSNPQ